MSPEKMQAYGDTLWSGLRPRVSEKNLPTFRARLAVKIYGHYPNLYADLCGVDHVGSQRVTILREKLEAQDRFWKPFYARQPLRISVPRPDGPMVHRWGRVQIKLLTGILPRLESATAKWRDNHNVVLTDTEGNDLTMRLDLGQSRYHYRRFLVKFAPEALSTGFYITNWSTQQKVNDYGHTSMEDVATILPHPDPKWVDVAVAALGDSPRSHEILDRIKSKATINSMGSDREGMTLSISCGQAGRYKALYGEREATLAARLAACQRVSDQIDEEVQRAIWKIVKRKTLHREETHRAVLVAEEAFRRGRLGVVSAAAEYCYVKAIKQHPVPDLPDMNWYRTDWVTVAKRKNFSGVTQDRMEAWDKSQDRLFDAYAHYGEVHGRAYLSELHDRINLPTLFLLAA